QIQVIACCSFGVWGWSEVQGGRGGGQMFDVVQFLGGQVDVAQLPHPLAPDRFQAGTGGELGRVEESGGVVGGAFGQVLDLVQVRSEEHTSELQSRFDLVCRLLLEKKS